LWRHRNDTMQHMIKNNLAILTGRTSKVDVADHFFVTSSVSEAKTAEYSKQSYHFPLYLYSENVDSLFEEGRSTNFTDDFKTYKKEHLADFTDEQIFYYIYGLLYSPTYRTRYNEFLKTDFPRIDFSYDIQTICKFGEVLVQLHLLTHPIFEDSDHWGLAVEGKDYSISFARKSDIYRDGKIYLNSHTYISGVEETVFRFTIGGYQVCDKWLSDRKNTTLTLDELMHYLKIIVSLKETLGVMDLIDEVLKQ
ncbi:MAG: type ISP restriction/modification enzyme, partial [Sulfuricurvum sp.]